VAGKNLQVDASEVLTPFCEEMKIINTGQNQQLRAKFICQI
jgi:hypothetical protein